MSVRVTFTELMVPAHTVSDRTGEVDGPVADEVEVPSDVSVLAILGAHFDESIGMWRVLVRRYVDVPDEPPPPPWPGF